MRNLGRFCAFCSLSRGGDAVSHFENVCRERFAALSDAVYEIGKVIIGEAVELQEAVLYEVDGSGVGAGTGHSCCISLA